MIDRAATVALLDIALVGVAAVGYVAGALGGAAAGMLLILGVLLNVVWLIGTLVAGALSEQRAASERRRARRRK